MKEKILIVEDDRDIAKLIDYNLKKELYRTIISGNGEEAISLLKKERPDLILLDLMLPGMDGLEVCKAVKSKRHLSAIPVIMITAKGSESDKVIGLELGADDYMVKPFSIRELLARVKAVLRRSQEKTGIGQVIESRGLSIDFDRISVSVNGRPVELTSKEFELLAHLVKASGRVLTRDFLLDSVWGYTMSSQIQTRTVDVHIRMLRRKLKSLGKLIITVKNYGYRFDSED